MLSIGKLGTGHHAYYELSVASGAEDYYTGHGEARGWYLGAGSDALDLTGVVQQGDLKHLFRGTHPHQAERWHQRQEHDRKPRTITLPDGRVIEGPAPQPTAAFDLTFSAPKSVSVLWGLSGGPVQRNVRAAHEAAVRAAFDYLERTACVTRRGRGGARQLRGEGFVAAAFQHRVSRAGDPQLHTHVLVANATKAEGRYTALHGALLYREAKTAGFLYHAALRAELTQHLGVEWHRDPASPHPEIVGIDRVLRDAFSKRAAEIAQQLEVTGHTSARAANAAAIDTRAAKQYLDDTTNLHDRWIGEATTIDAPDVLHAIGRIDARTPILTDTRAIVRQVATEAFAPTGLTEKRTTFHRRDIIQLACEQATAGASVAQLERLADAILDHAEREIVQLRSDAAPTPEGSPKRADGTPLTDGRADTPYTTRELLGAELSIIDSAHKRAAERTAVVKQRDVERLVNERPSHRQLSTEQRAMVMQLTTSGSGVEVVVGLAGAGKTFSLDAAHDAWRSAGIHVRGCSTALTAAKTLEAEASIPSETIAMLRAWHEHAHESGDHTKLDAAIPKRGVLIVDEAGMTETRDLAFLTKLAAERQTKLVLVGDHRQLPEIGAGGAFKHLVHSFEPQGRATRLTENRRQLHHWERKSLSELRAGSLEHAIAAYESQNRIVTDPSPDQLRERLAADWLNARQRGRDVAMIAYTNADVSTLNDAARRLLDERGLLGAQRVAIGGREWAAGDELICSRNNRALGLTNGTRGIVTHVDDMGVDIRMTTGKLLRVPRDYIQRGEASHAYATTGHKTQGMTINGEAFVLASDHISREWMYVAMSRAKDASRIYVDTHEYNPATGRELTPRERHDMAILDLYDMASRSGAQTLARTQGEPVDPQRLDRNDLRQQLRRQQLRHPRESNSRSMPMHDRSRRDRGMGRGK